MVPLKKAVESWIDGPDRGAPRVTRDADGSTILDDRGASPPRVRHLDDVEAAVYDACDGICRRDALLARLEESFPDDARLAEKIDAALTSFVEQRLMVRDGDRFLSLALQTGG